MTNDTKIYEILKTQNIETIRNSEIDFSQMNLASILEKFYQDEISIKLDFIQFLINNTADINKQETDGNTSLMVAATHEDLDTVKMFVQNGSDVNIAATDGETALTLSLDYFFKNNDFSMTEYLIDNGADINYADKSGMSILAAVSMILAYSDSDNAKTMTSLKKIDSLYAENIQKFSQISKQYALNLMEYLLKKGANPNIRFISMDDEYIVPLLSLLTIMHNVEAVELLLRYGANPNVELNKNLSFLDFCIISGNLEAVKLLLQYKVDLDFTDKEQNFLMLLLSSKQNWKLTIPENVYELMFEDFNKNKFKIAKLLIEHGVNVDAILQQAILAYLTDTKKAVADIENSDFSLNDKIKFTLLESNRYDVKLKTIKFLLENGANINIDYEEPELHPLYMAVKKENLPLVKLLVQYVDDVNIYRNHNKTISLFFDALKYRDYEIIEVLIKHGVDVNEVILNITPLLFAIYNNDMKLAQMLIENGADVNQNITEPINMSPLLYAVKFNYVDMVKLLIEKGADIDYKFICKDDQGDLVLPISVYEIANEYDDGKLADYLEEKGADINFPDEREKDDFDFFYDDCKTLDFFANFFVKSKKTGVINEEIRFGKKRQELKQLIVDLNKKIATFRDEKFALYQSSTINFEDAIESKSMDKLQKLIDAGFDLSYLNINDLFLNDFPDKFIYEVAKQSQNINAQTEDGMTPLMFASKANNMEIVRVLLDKGADKTMKSSAGKRAKDFTNDKELRKFIIAYTAPIDDSKQLSQLLKSFSNQKLKYTNHDWDDSSLTYDKFMRDVEDGWNEIKDKLKTLLSEKTYMDMEQFLFNDQLGQHDSQGNIISWGDNITIGWSSKEIATAGNIPHLNKTFKMAMDYFKSLFVIKQDHKDLKFLKKFTKLRKEHNYKFNLDLEQIKNVSIENIFTDVHKLESALATILSEINDRVDDDKKDVKVTLEQNEQRTMVTLKIIHKGSTSKSDAEILEKAIEKSGGFKGIYNNLSSLCDWSVETFCPDGKRYKIDYLYPEIDNNKPHSYPIEESIEGFTHILRFPI